MDVNQRISNIGPYFVAFNVCDGVAYVIVKFPTKWTLFDKDAICDEYNVAIEQREEGIYFLCEMSNGFDGLFDAIDFVIVNNKQLEEKSSLLQQKIKDLSNLFTQEPLERLKKLQFTFEGEETINLPIPSLKPKSKTDEVPEPEKVSEVVPDVKPEKKTNKKKQKITEEDSDLMSFAKENITNK